MNYVMGDFNGWLDDLMDQGKKVLTDPKTTQAIVQAGVKLIAPPPKSSTPKPVIPTAPVTPGAPIVPAKDNTMLYVGLGVAGVALVAVVAGIVMARKKK